MDTGKLKSFASEARKVLLNGVMQRITELGFNNKGYVIERPQPVSGGYLFGGRIFDDVDFYPSWLKLEEAILHHNVKNVVEEAAYTWFNRLIAIRILQKNKLIQPVLSYDAATRLPLIMAEARRGMHPQMSAEDEERLSRQLMDDKKEIEQFALLIKAFCQSTPALNNIFGSVDDYTMLLLPTRILEKGNFIDLLNNSEEWITEEDYRSTELIGWLYQFYISDKKDEVFASFKNKHKAEAEDIPAATQIFTPNWIVKYMVQNTIGRIYLDNHRRSDLREDMKYLVEPSESDPDSRLKVDLEDMTMIDPGCGSAHILNEGFNLFLAMYKEEGYSVREAVELILKNNLIGLDIDTRAKQLATFSLLLKATQQDPEFIDCHVMPRIYDMPDFDESLLPGGTLQNYLPHFFLGGTRQDIEQTLAALEIMRSASNFGSIMKFDIAPSTREDISKAVQRIEEGNEQEHYFILPFIKVILALTDKYTAVAANPPYMSSKNMNSDLSNYLRTNYYIGCSDLCTSFVLKFKDLCEDRGKYSFIIPLSWMFITSYTQLRKSIVDNQSIDSLLQLSRGVFGADFGSSVTCITNSESNNSLGVYFRLVDRTFQEFEQDHLRLLFEKSLKNHNFRYEFTSYSKSSTSFHDSPLGNLIYYSGINQIIFHDFPECIFGYWVSDAVLEDFNNSYLSQSCPVKKGIDTGKNDRFLRYWHEVSSNKFSFWAYSRKWFAYIKGGRFRKWYGNFELVVNWENHGEEIKAFKGSTIRNKQYIKKEAITWSLTSSSNVFGSRYIPENAVFDNNGSSAFPNSNKEYIMAFMNSKPTSTFLVIMNPTMAFQVGNIANLPYIYNASINVSPLVKTCTNIEKQDWDVHETSWDFKGNELIRMQHNCMANSADVNMLDEDERQELLASVTPLNNNLVKNCVEAYKNEWTRKFNQIHSNEEELNRLFIDIYGLQDELTPDVPLDEITILQQGEIRIENNEIVWNEDELIKQFISYAIGCFMGRYRLDKPEIHIAYPNPSKEDITPYEYNGGQFEIDDDGIIPIIPSELNPFPDNSELRLRDFVSKVFTDKYITDNLNYIEHSLGKTMDAYMYKDFYKDHLTRYQKRPIYWLFSSNPKKKGAFQVLVYMHRMDKFTVSRIRNNYLLPYILHLQQIVNKLSVKSAYLNRTETKTFETVKKALAECNEYDIRLNDIAHQQIKFDLDDGVKVNYAKFGDVVMKLK